MCIRQSASSWYKKSYNFAVYKNAPLTLACMLAVHFIDYIDFYCSRFRNNCRGLIKIHTINSKVVKRFFQTSKFTFFVTEQMVLDEINKLTPILKEYSIPYTINYN